MANKVNYGYTGGMPFEQDDLEFDRNGLEEALKGALSPYAKQHDYNIIISGCELTDFDNPNSSTYDVAEGYVMLDGEILKVEAQSGVQKATGSDVDHFAVNVTFPPDGQQVYEDDQTATNSWEERRAVAQASAALSPYLAVDGPRLKDITIDFVQTNQNFFKKRQDWAYASTVSLQSGGIVPLPTDGNIFRCDIAQFDQINGFDGPTNKASIFIVYFTKPGFIKFGANPSGGIGISDPRNTGSLLIVPDEPLVFVSGFPYQIINPSPYAIDQISDLLNRLPNKAERVSSINPKTNLTFENDWSGLSGNAPSYYEDQFNRVHLEGILTPGSSSSSGDVAISGLPAPSKELVQEATSYSASSGFTQPRLDSGERNGVTINTNGYLKVWINGSQKETSLYGISYRKA
jgi:hypothetical protein